MQNQSSQTERDAMRKTAMLKALITAPSDPEDCNAVEEQLTAYHLATLQQQDHDSQWEPIRQHLAQCPSCAEQYRWLQEWEESEAGLAIVPAASEPNLEFLRKPATDAAALEQRQRPIWATFWEETVNGLLIDLGLELRNALPQNRLAAAGLRGDDQPKVGYEFVLERPRGARIHLDIEQAADTELSVLKVTVASAEWAPDTLPEIEVVLLLRDQPTNSQFVDRHGIAKFAVATVDLPLAKIAIHEATNEAADV